VPSLLPVGPAEAPSERRDDQLRRSRPTVALWRKGDNRVRVGLHFYVFFGV